MTAVEEPGTEAGEQPHHAPPPRRGGRDERREATLQALATGKQAHCAYCGEALPPLPSRGGRPTPYCAPDPDRYGSWGAKTISCAMLDEHREIWTRVYGAEQPMTHLDTHVLDARLGAVTAVLDPIRTEVAALQSHVRDELTAALSAREEAEDQRARALEAAEAARGEAEQAEARAEQARHDTETARTARTEAEGIAEQARTERDRALDDRDEARGEAETARGERQSALDQAATAQQRNGELQDSLAAEQAAALDKLDRARRDEEQARARLREELEEHHRRALAARAEEFNTRLSQANTAADRRIGELAEQLATATRDYAASLAPLHERISTLHEQIADRDGVVEQHRGRLAEVHAQLTAALEEVPEESADLRNRLHEVLSRAGGEPHDQPDGPRSAAETEGE